MRLSYKQFIVGTLIAGAVMSAGMAFAQNDSTAPMTMDEAKTIAQTGVCAAAGTVTDNATYNTENTTWRVSLIRTSPLAARLVLLTRRPKRQK